MAKFLLILRGGPGELQTYSPAEIQQMIEKYDAWFNQIASEGRLGYADKLKPFSGRVLQGYGESMAITDGPFGETKELVGGIFNIEAEDFNHAVQLIKNCPQLEYGGSAEIREVDCLEEHRE